MKKLLTLVTVSFLLIGCPNQDELVDIPEFNEIYELDGQHVVLGKYAIISKKPFKIKYLNDVELLECDGCVAIKYDVFMEMVRIINGENPTKEFVKRQETINDGAILYDFKMESGSIPPGQ